MGFNWRKKKQQQKMHHNEFQSNRTIYRWPSISVCNSSVKKRNPTPDVEPTGDGTDPTSKQSSGSQRNADRPFPFPKSSAGAAIPTRIAQNTWRNFQSPPPQATGHASRQQLFLLRSAPRSRPRPSQIRPRPWRRAGECSSRSSSSATAGAPRDRFHFSIPSRPYFLFPAAPFF